MTTPEYTKKAIKNYRDKFYVVNVRLPKGTKERIYNCTGLTANKFINDIVLKELDQLEKNN